MAQMKIIAGLPRVFAKQSGGKFRYVRSVFRVFSVFRGFNSCETIPHNLFPQAALSANVTQPPSLQPRNTRKMCGRTEEIEHFFTLSLSLLRNSYCFSACFPQ